MNYHVAWSIQFLCSDDHYTWFQQFIEDVRDTLGEIGPDANKALRTKYPTYTWEENYNSLELERAAGMAVLYNADCDGGADQGIAMVQAYLAHFQLPHRVSFNVYWVDRNEGGGAAVVITKHGTKERRFDDVLDALVAEDEINWRTQQEGSHADQLEKARAGS